MPLIDLSDAVNVVEGYRDRNPDSWSLCNSIKFDIAELPTISPDEVRGVGEITDDDACPVCGCWIPTDDAHDAIFENEVKFCYYCGTRLRMKGAEDGTTD